MMGIFNQHSNNQPQQQSFLRGLRGSPGVGFSLTRDGNYDMNNKKLKNVGEGVESSDAVTKHQLEVSMNTKADKNSLTTFVKKDSPEVGADLDMKGFEVKNIKLIPTGDLNATSKKYVDRKVNKKADITSLTQYVKKDSPEVDADLDMKGFEVKNIKLIPTGDLNATSKKYVDRKVNKKADITSLTQYVKKDSPEVVADLDMKGYRVTNLTNPTLYDSEAANKKYVDDSILKSHVKPSHTPKNGFQYLMNDVNEWSSEYGIKVDKFIDLQESPHSWDKRVLKITPVKNGSNYRFRLGLQMFGMKTNETYSLMVERYNRDYKTWQREQTYVNGTGIWVRTYNITKLQYHYGVNNTLYYTKTLIKFKKTSSSAPVFVYYTVHFDDNGGDLNTYPKDFINQIYLVAYGVEGLVDNVDPEVYDAHEAFEIDNTKMKMRVPLDMNGKQLMNVNYGAFVIEHNKMKMNMPLNMNGKVIVNFKLNPNFGHVFNLIKCTTNYSNDRSFFILARKDNRLALSFTVPVIINSITFPNKHTFHKDAIIRIITPELGDKYEFKLINLVDNGLTRNLAPWLQLSTGLRYMRLSNLINNIRSPFDVDVIVSYM